MATTVTSVSWPKYRCRLENVEMYWQTHRTCLLNSSNSKSTLLLLWTWSRSVYLGGIAKSDPAYCDRCYRSVICLSACLLSVTLVHPAKAVGRNETPVSRNHSRVVPSNTVLDRAPVSTGFGSLNPPPQFCSDAAYRQISLAFVMCAIDTGGPRKLSGRSVGYYCWSFATWRHCMK